MVICESINDKGGFWSLYEIAEAFDLMREFEEFKTENIRHIEYDNDEKKFYSEDDYMLRDLLNKSDRNFWFESYDDGNEEYWRVIEFPKENVVNYFVWGSNDEGKIQEVNFAFYDSAKKYAQTEAETKKKTYTIVKKVQLETFSGRED